VLTFGRSISTGLRYYFLSNKIPLDYLSQKRIAQKIGSSLHSGRLFMSTARAKLDDELLPLTSRLSKKGSVSGRPVPGVCGE
jgi:hypothetical protein